jgi:hypothetical protein
VHNFISIGELEGEEEVQNDSLVELEPIRSKLTTIAGYDNLVEVERYQEVH